MSEKKQPNEGLVGGGKSQRKKNQQNPGFFGNRSQDMASRNAMKHQRSKGHSKGR